MARPGFMGRTRELALLSKRLDRVVAGGTGVALAVRGRRQVGKSRLVQEFCDSVGVPYFYFTATKGASSVEAVSTFVAELRDSGLPAADHRDLLPERTAGSWPDAFRYLSAAVPAQPVIVVLDEVPWLADQDDLFDGALQAAWDRLLSPRPVLLLLLGSDLHMMKRLTAYDRPFFGRADNLVLGPLNLAEAANALDLPAAEAIDAHLITGGLPGILRTWLPGTAPEAFLSAEIADPASPLVSVPEAVLLAEFPSPDQARRVLEAVGSGDRTHATIAPPRAAARVHGLLERSRRCCANSSGTSACSPSMSRCRRARASLRSAASPTATFYLAALRTTQDLARRGRTEAAARLVARRWPTWRGRAVEPLIRESLALVCAAGATPWPEAEEVGGWWNRQFNPEIDLVGADRAPVARQVFFAGSIKWLGTPFDRHDLAALQRNAPKVHGFDPGGSDLMAVSLSGTDGIHDHELALVWGAQNIVAAWQ